MNCTLHYNPKLNLILSLKLNPNQRSFLLHKIEELDKESSNYESEKQRLMVRQLELQVHRETERDRERDRERGNRLTEQSVVDSK